MKSYNYKSPIINLISAIGLLICSYFFIRTVFISNVDFWIKVFCFFFFISLFALSIVIGYVFLRNIKPKQILLKENKIEIPDMFGDKNSTFYYSDINGAIYMATEKNGYIRELFIKRIWMKNKSEYLELFEFLNDKKIYK